VNMISLLGWIDFSDFSELAFWIVRKSKLRPKRTTFVPRYGFRRSSSSAANSKWLNWLKFWFFPVHDSYLKQKSQLAKKIDIFTC
jgi:hypothetical protein